jgi:protein SCO1/2
LGAALLLAGACSRHGSAGSSTAPVLGASANPSSGSSLPVYGKLPELRLLDQDSHPFQATQLRGHVWITAFMFTSCPMECPILAQRMSYLQKLLAGRSPSIQLLSISVNPSQDTPAVLREYGTRFHRDPARWTFLTGDSDPVLRTVSAGYDRGVSGKKTPGGFEVLHGDSLVLIDGDGHIRGYYRKDNAEVARLLADADRLASRML